MRTTGFIFDYARCVGCEACVVACSNENGLSDLPYRQVVRANALKLPLLGFVSLSVACNHCMEAPCIEACPAQAYRRDPITAAVIHYSERCIGCRYCTWVCPYGAPKYYPQKGTVDKCNLCNSRLKRQNEPACTEACPVNALSFGEIEVPGCVDAPGLAPLPTGPRLQVKNSSVLHFSTRQDANAVGYEQTKMLRSADKSGTLSFFMEFPLILFTFLVALLSGWFASGILVDFSDTNRYVFVGLGVTAMLVSLLHLGKPFRAYRSFINIKSSWLSREIVLFSLFLLTAIYCLFQNPIPAVWYIGILIAILLLISIERITAVLQHHHKGLHSANMLLTSVLFFALFAGIAKLTLILLVAKSVLYLYRHSPAGNAQTSALLIPVKFVALIIPIARLAIIGSSTTGIVMLIVAGELIDRTEYYLDSYIQLPKRLIG